MQKKLVIDINQGLPQVPAVQKGRFGSFQGQFGTANVQVQLMSP